MKNVASNMGELIGNTPLVKLNRIAEGCFAEVYCKLEFFNPCHSVKDRIGWEMIEDAEKKGLIKPGGVIIEPTSGNTGIALAFTCAVKGYSLIVTMPESMTIERRKMISSFGAKIVLTPAGEGMRGAINKAKELLEQTPDSYMPQQFENPANPAVHRRTTGEEIWDHTGGDVDFFIAGVGTGGTITGAGEVLKEKNPNIKCVAVEPENSAVLSGNPPGSHKIQGIGAGFIPKNLNVDVIDEIIKVKEDDAFLTARKLAHLEGILCGISSGANVWSALSIAKREENRGKKIVVIICDTGERYLSTELFN